MAIRRVRPGEGAALREIRLRALRDAPWAFGATLEEEAALGDFEWEERAAANAAGETTVVFVTDDWTAMAGGYVPRPDQPVVRLWGMWIAPAARGRGLAAELVDAVEAWARERDAVELELAVSDRADAAFTAYSRMGFELMPEREPLQSGGTLCTRRMRRLLPG
jgi:GNAT superfamily N-acetyltransferase